MQQCGDHSGFNAMLKNLTEGMRRIELNTERIWTVVEENRRDTDVRIRELGDANMQGDVQRRLSDARREARLQMWKFISLVLGISLAALTILNRLSVDFLSPK